MATVLQYRSAAVVPATALEWVTGPGELRAALAPAKRWLRVTSLAVLTLVAGLSELIFLVGIGDAILSDGLRADVGCPVVAAVLLGGFLWWAGAALSAAARGGPSPMILVRGGVLAVHDPTRASRPLRMATADVAGMWVYPLVRRSSGSGRVRVRIETAGGRWVDYDLRTADVGCAAVLEAELRRAVQLTDG